MKKWKVLTPLTLAAAGAAALGVLTLIRREPETAAGTSAAPAAAVPQNHKSGSYSFISGYQDAATVELRFDYDGDKFSYAVVEDDFLCETGDSHVGLLRGGLFNAQIEYASYYQGEGFEDLIRQISEKYQDFSPVAYGDNTGIQYRAGDAVCFCFPAGEDPHSYLLITLLKGPDFDEKKMVLTELPELITVLQSMHVSVRR